MGKGIGFALKDTGVIDSDDPRIEKAVSAGGPGGMESVSDSAGGH
ncbi:hypothetical protein ACFTAO_20185 [Paenibacillus rhizoplanae]